MIPHENRTGPTTLRPPDDARRPWAVLRSVTHHPFVYNRMLGPVDPDARPGDVVNVYDKVGRLFGRALYSPTSQISLRMLGYNDTAIDDEWWRAMLDRAVQLRRRLRLDETTDAYRLVHAEGDGLSGLIVERFADCLVFEVFCIGMFQRCRQFADALGSILGAPTTLERPGSPGERWRVIVRADERIEKIEGFRASAFESEPKAKVTIREHGVRYHVDAAAGHKTGFFCDQRDNRRRFAGLCADADVLDLCSYTGGFGICAKVLGLARDVTSVDLDEKAIVVARKNVNLNQTRVNLVHADVFPYLRQMIANGRQYDAVVCDPSKFATTRDDLDEALQKYSDLNGLAARVVRPGGILLTCSCSGLVSPDRFGEAVYFGIRRAGRSLQVFERTGAAADHPVMANCPESAYLKALWCRVM
jgi:23S rRNA (cytosine1962-C5)-methyltransferase